MIETNIIYCGDCIEVMEQWEDNVIDLTVTSPPYDNLRDYKGYSFDFESIAGQLYRVTKQGGVVVWIVGDATTKGSETGTSFKQALCFKSIGFNLHDTMIYQKRNYLPAQKINHRYANSFEYMFVFSKGKPKIFNPTTEKCKWGGIGKVGTFRNKAGITTQRSVTINEYKIISNIWDYETGYMKSTKDKIAYEHPATFPEKLAHDHIISWSNEGDIVLDPMCGSGTTLKEATKLNRRFIGIDISSEYCAIAQERLNAYNL